MDRARPRSSGAEVLRVTMSAPGVDWSATIREIGVSPAQAEAMEGLAAGEAGKVLPGGISEMSADSAPGKGRRPTNLTCSQGGSRTARCDGRGSRAAPPPSSRYPLVLAAACDGKNQDISSPNSRRADKICGRKAHHGQTDLLRDHVARRLRGGRGRRLRLECAGRGGAHLRQRTRADGR